MAYNQSPWSFYQLTAGILSFMQQEAAKVIMATQVADDYKLVSVMCTGFPAPH